MSSTESESFNLTARQIALGQAPFLQAGNLSDELTINDQSITKRDYIRQLFFDLGIEVEFSGKNQHEKGVVIDIDEDKLIANGFNPDALRFGQTIVKAVSQ